MDAIIAMQIGQTLNEMRERDKSESWENEENALDTRDALLIWLVSQAAWLYL